MPFDSAEFPGLFSGKQDGGIHSNQRSIFKRELTKTMNDMLHQTSCPKCQHVLEEPANFCPQCGTRIFALSLEERRSILASLDELDRGPLLGRRSLLEDQLPAMTQAKFGKGASLRVTGPTGIGKSLFVSALGGLARQMGFKTQIMKAVAEERYLSFAPFRRLASQALGFEDANSVEELNTRLNNLLIDGFGPTDAEYLKLLYPVEYKGLKTRKLSETVRLQSAIASLDRLLQVLSKDRPLFLVLDQFRFADAFTRLLWETLEQSVTDRPIFLIAVSREPSLPTRQNDHIKHLELPPIVPKEMKSLLRRWAGNRELPEPCLDTILTATQGNPALGRGLLHYAMNNQILTDHNGQWIYNQPQEDWCPKSLTETIHRQLETLSPPQGELLRLISVLGEESMPDVLRDLYSFKEYLDEDLKAVVDKGFLIAEDGGKGRIRLRESYMAEAIYAEMSPAMRHEFHKKSGARLQKGAQQPLMTSNAVLFHLIQTTETIADAIYYLEQSADKLFQGLHVVLAGMCYQKASQLLRKELADTSDRFALQVKLAHILRKFSKCQVAMNDRINAAKTLQTAIGLADNVDAPYVSFELRMDLAHVLTDLQRPKEARALLEQTVARVDELSDTFFSGEVIAEAGNILQELNEPHLAKGCLERAHSLLQDEAETVRPALRRQGMVDLHLARLHLDQGHLTQAMELLHSALDTIDVDETPSVFLEIVLLLTASYAQQKRVSEAKHYAELGRKTALTFGDNQLLPQMTFRLGRAFALENDVASAKSYFTQALKEATDCRWNEGMIRSTQELKKLGEA